MMLPSRHLYQIESRLFGHPLYLLLLNEKVASCTFSFEKHRRHKAAILTTLAIDMVQPAGLPASLTASLGDYLRGDSPLSWPYTPLLLHQGTVFQRLVWRHIVQIPFGQTLSYGELAEKIGGGEYARAVGGACNANPLALLVPCHRVVGKKALGGFAAEVEIKRKLLALENTANRSPMKRGQ